MCVCVVGKPSIIANNNRYDGVAASDQVYPNLNRGVAAGDICVFYGGAWRYPSNVMYRFDLSSSLASLIAANSTRVWWSRSTPPYPTQLYRPAVIATNNGNGLIIAAGGARTDDVFYDFVTDAVHFYNATSDTWLANGTLSVARIDMATATLGDWVTHPTPTTTMNE